MVVWFERIFDIFKSRFTIFKSAPPFLFKTQAELVLACAALHRFLKQFCVKIVALINFLQ